jgi:hypothetical protein
VGLPPGRSATAPPAETGGGVARPATSWEYKFIEHFETDHGEQFKQVIKQVGADGWEFCSSQEFKKSNGTSFLMLVFKKRKEMLSGVSVGGMGPAGSGSGRPSTIGPAPPAGPAFPSPAGPGPSSGSAFSPAGPTPAYEAPIRGTLPDLVFLKVKHARASELAKVLKDVLAVEVSADSRTNQLIVRSSAKMLEEIKVLIEKLDVPISGDEILPPSQKAKP